MIDNEGLKAILCVPGKHAPIGMRHITARVFDGVETVEYQFGRDVPLRKVWEMIPRLYADSKFPPVRKQKIKKAV
jgi:hypothetical protein